MSELIVAQRRAESYLLLERLGSGGAAEAWRALRRHGVLEDEVCLKRARSLVTGEARRSFLEEARVLGRVRHQNVVSLLDVAEDPEGRLLIVLELVRGADLRALGRRLEARRERLSEATIASLGLAVCRALGAAQRAVPGGVVHRDLTPHNVLVSREGEIKLADFGVARALDRGTWTRDGVIKGKLAYLSPEQIDSKRLDVRSDLFALGVVLYELYTGRRPFDGIDALRLARAISQGERAPLPEGCRGSGLAATIAWLLEPDRDRRPATAEAAAEALSRHAHEHHARRELGTRIRALASSKHSALAVDAA